ncbi:efflux RND transporter periplasmic adaptor subunit [Sneathiella litorea]|uniref:Efflux RND transporter periplasmic adaptor subunit n=1 Tax=Sneathiella litorea TaxID=2606216 RepID=A0A6L8W830_9PROT|nr:efflux RND transporter periplasmic adaptor subunit [Sneathiella litorea]MZR30683.1 efflux RND transporter periplasmic adaptor subunit [Sneathiella litorea]
MARQTGILCRALLAAFVLGYPLNVQAQAAKPQGPAEVGVVEVHQQTVPHTVQIPGRAVAYEQAGVRPRVTGVITEKLYTPGKELKAGDPLFQLDDASYAAEVASKEAAVVEAEADLPVKQAAYDRALRLHSTGTTSEATLETAQSSLASAKATLQSAKAALKFARTQLSWTTIRAPIDGVAEVASVSIGDLVTEGQTNTLTTITTLDPIDADMLDTSANILAVRKQIRSGTLEFNRKITAQLTLENGEVYLGEGSLVTPSASVSTSTGTVSVRFRFENPHHLIRPGMFLRAQVTLGTKSAVLVPQRAGEHGADGKLKIFVVGEDGKSKQLSLETAGSYENNWIIQSGLEDGTLVIVDGQKNLRAGVELKPVPVKIDADGLTQEKLVGLE